MELGSLESLDHSLLLSTLSEFQFFEGGGEGGKEVIHFYAACCPITVLLLTARIVYH